jgi:hypothetical protein
VRGTSVHSRIVSSCNVITLRFRVVTQTDRAQAMTGDVRRVHHGGGLHDYPESALHNLFQVPRSHMIGTRVWRGKWSTTWALRWRS